MHLLERRTIFGNESLTFLNHFEWKMVYFKVRGSVSVNSSLEQLQWTIFPRWWWFIMLEYVSSMVVSVNPQIIKYTSGLFPFFFVFGKLLYSFCLFPIWWFLQFPASISCQSNLMIFIFTIPRSTYFFEFLNHTWIELFCLLRVGWHYGLFLQEYQVVSQEK